MSSNADGVREWERRRVCTFLAGLSLSAVARGGGDKYKA
jgi:hypothetical protein